ncbi:MAG: alpha/beta hydrolase [Chitinophagaceae bacterium]|nr:alpha/beta hydrolase [Chitinophagaceae bacterium]
MKHLLLLHGAVGAKEQLQPLADLLKDEYSIHLFNFNGHGGKPFAADEFSISSFANELHAFVVEKQIEHACVFGYSMGGYVALFLAKKYPSLFSKAVTLATKFHWNENIAAKEAAMLNPEVILEKLPAFAAQLKDRHQPNDWQQVLVKTKEMLLQMGKENPLQLHDYAAITTPVCLLLGDNDKMVTKEETTAVQQRLPNAEFQLLQNTAHPIEKTDLQQLASVIRNFCN